ncbi:hypothetical protein MMPV_006252 [Pyropia vietnamensis]
MSRFFRSTSTLLTGGGALLSPPPPDPSSAAYAAGVRTAIVGLLCAAGVSAVTAAALPAVVAAVGFRTVWAVTLGGFAVTLAAAPAVSDREGLTALLSATGVPMGVAATLPWAAAAAAAVARRDSRSSSGRADATGRMMGIFNLSQCLSNMLVALASAGLVRRLGTGAPGLARVLAIAAAPVAVAAVGAAIMVTPSGLGGTRRRGRGRAAVWRDGGTAVAAAKDVEWDGGGKGGGLRDDDDTDSTDGEDVEVLVVAPREQLDGRSVEGENASGEGAPPAG